MMAWRLQSNSNLSLGEFTVINEEMAEHVLLQMNLELDQIDERIPSLVGLRWEAVRLAGANSSTYEEVVKIANEINWWWAGGECEPDYLIGCSRCRPFRTARHIYYVANSQYGYAYHFDPGCRSFHTTAELIWGYSDDFPGYFPCEVCVF
jgi:hypothetical protein